MASFADRNLDDSHAIDGADMARTRMLEALGFASGGGNTLTAGQGSNDTMWGGAAVVSPTATIRANTFIFNQGIGHDTIMDFRSGMDHIDLEGVVTAVALGIPEETGREIWIGARRDRDVLCAHGYGALGRAGRSA